MCTQCTLHSSFFIFCCFYLYNVHIKECTFGIFYKLILLNYSWYNEKRAYRCRNTRTNSFFQYSLFRTQAASFLFFLRPSELERPNKNIYIVSSNIFVLLNNKFHLAKNITQEGGGQIYILSFFLSINLSFLHLSINPCIYIYLSIYQFISMFEPGGFFTKDQRYFSIYLSINL